MLFVFGCTNLLINRSNPNYFKGKTKSITIGRFGSLTFAKGWLVCQAKGKVPNVRWLFFYSFCG